MKEILFNKEFLNNYKSLLVVFENCDVYEIAVDDILDIYCVAEQIGKKKNEYQAKKGYIKIAARASQTIECSVLENHEIDTEMDHRLQERLNMCDGCADITSFSLNNDRKCDIDIYVPYDPLLDILHDNEIEFSNCPSFEIDNEDNMIISFGECSKQPKRKDNNYSELIDGWNDAFGDFEPKILKVKALTLLSFGDKQTNFLFSFEFSNKNSKKDYAELVFIDCKTVSVEVSFGKIVDCEIIMSKMANGHIYVGFCGVGIDFICSSVQEYNYYCC